VGKTTSNLKQNSGLLLIKTTQKIFSLRSKGNSAWSKTRGWFSDKQHRARSADTKGSYTY